MSYNTYSELPMILPKSYSSEKYIDNISKSYGFITYCSATSRFAIVKKRISNALKFLLWGKYTRSELKSLVYDLYDENEDFILKSALVDRKSYNECIRIISPTATKSVCNYGYMRLLDSKEDITRLLDMNMGRNKRIWSWVKGRKNPKDITEYDTCIREFEEELGIPFPSDSVIIDKPIISEYITSNRKLVNKFWILIVENEFSTENVNINCDEIDKISWVSIDEARELILSYFIDALNEAYSIINNI